MVTAKILIYLVLVILIVDVEARRKGGKKEARTGACPTERGQDCVFPFKTACMSVKGSRCIFPFLYKGKEYTECTLYQASGGNPWCATALKADGNMQSWSACVKDVCLPDPTAVGGPHDKCVPSTSTEGKSWCATAVGEDGFFTTMDFCSDPNCVPTPPTTTTTTTTSTTVSTTTVTTTKTTATATACPTERGQACVFPFKTACMSVKGARCIFPFLYKGKEYTECTLYQASGGNPWCATALKADGNMQSWSACVKDVCLPDPTAVGGPHDKCVPSTSTEGKGWCATAVGEDGFFTTMDFCSDPNCAPTPPTTTTTTTTSTTTTTATTTDESDCGCDIPTECITGFSGSVYNTTEEFLGLADFFTRVKNLIEGGVGNLLTFLIPPTVKPPLLPFGQIENGTIAPLATTPGATSETTSAPAGTTAAPAGTTADPAGTTAAPTGTTAAPAGTTAAPSGTTAAPSGTTGTVLNRKGLFQDQVQALILSGERTDCRLLVNQITGGAFDNALSLIGMRNLAILKEGVQEASDRGVLDKVTEFISKAGIVIPEECVCQCGCQRIPTKAEAGATTEAAADGD